jgi:hypothetical protein
MKKAGFCHPATALPNQNNDWKISRAPKIISKKELKTRDLKSDRRAL